MLVGRRGFREGEGTGGRSKKGRPNRNSDVRCGHSHRTLSVRGVGCKEQEKTMIVVWGSTPQKGQRGLEINPLHSSHDRNGGGYKRMDGVGKG